jgi:hypothetical protein
MQKNGQKNEENINHPRTALVKFMGYVESKKSH